MKDECQFKSTIVLFIAEVVFTLQINTKVDQQ